jgi:hypothetical protein
MAASFTINGKAYSLPTEFTLGEMCDAERFFGVEIGNPTSSGARLAAAVIWIAVKRDDPSVTPEDIRDLPLDVLESLAVGDDTNPPAADSSEQSELSGNGSSSISESQGETRNGAGDPGSATGSTSDLAISRS